MHIYIYITRHGTYPSYASEDPGTKLTTISRDRSPHHGHAEDDDISDSGVLIPVPLRTYPSNWVSQSKQIEKSPAVYSTA